MPNPCIHQGHRQGFTLIDAIVVLVMLALLAAMWLPSATICGEKSHKTQCGSQQRQIVLAMTSYAEDHQGRWPVRLSDADGRNRGVEDPSWDGTATALASLEYLADQTHGALSLPSFLCPDGHIPRPDPPSDLSTDPHAIAGWVLAGPKRMGYSYDWSVPANAQSSRILLADREVTVHRNVVMATYVDGHTGAVSPTNGAFINRDVPGDDDIFTDVGDGPMYRPGGGSATRAFVR